ncbi:MAG TPA: Fic family protein [Chlorobaculum sp.]|nr:Fic family protein [Chlorobaculum sp.]
MIIVEAPARIEPCLPDSLTAEIVDLIATLSTSAERLGSRLHYKTAASLADLVRVMNCYYSNLIEGHNTRPRDIEQALQDRFEDDTERRNLQQEAVTHIRVQKEIDNLYAAGKLVEPASIDFIRWLHRQFYRDLPDSMRCMERDGLKVIFEPGEFRNLPIHDVAVGRHLPPSSIVVESFMTYFAEHYRFDHLGKGMRLAVMAASHHRFNYIHPFPDGNGRVSRLMSHAMALQSGIGAHGLWSVSRGLARGLDSRLDYKTLMDHADMPRQGDLDGRGNLSLKALNTFIAWFLKVCLDQVTYMDTLFELDTLSKRLKRYCEQQGWKPESFTILETTLLKGEIPRGEASRLSGLKERTARTVLSELLENGILGSESPKGNVSLRFPVCSAEILFPNLFPST